MAQDLTALKSQVDLIERTEVFDQTQVFKRFLKSLNLKVDQKFDQTAWFVIC